MGLLCLDFASIPQKGGGSGSFLIGRIEVGARLESLRDATRIENLVACHIAVPKYVYPRLPMLDFGKN